MLELFVAFWFLGSIHVLILYNHPLIFGFIVLFMCTGASALMCRFSGIYGFLLFMCIITGILMVFGYSISLVPDLDMKKSEREMTKEVAYSKFYGKIAMGCGFVAVCLLEWVMSFLDPSVVFSFFESSLHVSKAWAEGMSLLGVFLFLIMLFCVGIASKKKGALIK